MSKQLRYRGEFLSRSNVVWRVDILQEADAPFATVGDLTFEREEALVIDWKHQDKEAVICGSEATIRIESPGDRTYEDLYTIEVGRIRIEPYEMARYYVVTLTFSDFGILDRLKYNLVGMQTIQAIIVDALTRSTINYGSIDTSLCTTTFSDDTAATPATLSVRSDNFYDEDAKPSTLKEVVEGVLQPLALRMIQRNGKVYIYDLNGLNRSGARRAVTWDGDSQTLGVDKVANNVTVSFSPYSSADLLSGDLQFGGEYSVEMLNLLAERGHDYYSYYPDYSEDHKIGSNWDSNLINFTIFLSSKGKGLAYLNPSARYCHILPVVSGPSETDAIAWAFYSGGHGPIEEYHHWPKQILNTCRKENSGILMKSHKVFLPKLSSEGEKSYYVRLSLDFLLDARYNPFTEAKDGNEADNYDLMKRRTGWAFIPIAVNMYDGEGNVICHYVNSHNAKGACKGHLGCAKGRWENGAASFGDAYLEYYNADDLEENTGILGWKKNRHCIGRPYFANTQIYDSFKSMADGEYMPYPTQGGYLEVTVYGGVQCFDYDDILAPIFGGGFDWDWDACRRWTETGLYDKVRWMLYKAPKIELVKNNLIFDAAELEDIEYSGYINQAAKEEISIDTICGTANKICPTARGIYCRTSDSLQIQKLKRAGVTDHPEKLLIGTLYSQYAARKTKLSGEAVIDTGGLCVFTERNQQGKLFLMTGEQQDVIADTSEIEITEFSPDEYDAIEEVS